MQSSTIFPVSPGCSNNSNTSVELQQSRKEQGDENEDLEFTFMCREPCLSPVPADKIFHKGKIKPLYQIEDAHNKGSINSMMYQNPSTMLSKKFPIKESGQTSCTKPEADELESVQPGSYCVWKPKACKYSNSAASSGRWKFKEILRRSKSDSGRWACLSSPDAREQESHRHKPE